MSAWFVVQTNPQRESFAAGMLEEFRPYLPLIKTATGRIAALFPSYLFVPETMYWGRVKHAMGVRQLLMVGQDRPARIADSVIKSWRSREQNGIVKLPPPPKYQPGQRLVITRGTLRYKTALYVGMSGKDREKVLIQMLGSWVPLTIASTDLAPEVLSKSRQNLPDQHKPL